MSHTSSTVVVGADRSARTEAALLRDEPFKASSAFGPIGCLAHLGDTLNLRDPVCQPLFGKLGLRFLEGSLPTAGPGPGTCPRPRRGGHAALPSSAARTVSHLRYDGRLHPIGTSFGETVDQPVAVRIRGRSLATLSVHVGPADPVEANPDRPGLLPERIMDRDGSCLPVDDHSNDVTILIRVLWRLPRPASSSFGFFVAVSENNLADQVLVNLVDRLVNAALTPLPRSVVRSPKPSGDRQKPSGDRL